MKYLVAFVESIEKTSNRPDTKTALQSAELFTVVPGAGLEFTWLTSQTGLPG
jgi:hypothetical protein